MNEENLRQLLQSADAAEPFPLAALDGLADRVRAIAAKRARRRRILATITAVAVLLAATPLLVRHHAAAPPPQIAQIPAPNFDEESAAMDAEIAHCNATIAALKRCETIAVLRDNLDPESVEHVAAQMIDRAKTLPAPGRRNLLAAVIRTFPSTISAAIARGELNSSALEKSL